MGSSPWPHPSVNSRCLFLPILQHLPTQSMWVALRKRG
jgi:hypothetical protein